MIYNGFRFNILRGFGMMSEKFYKNVLTLEEKNNKLEEAMINDDLEQVKYWIENGAELKTINWLFIKSFRQFNEITKYLITHQNMDINMYNGQALIEAVGAGKIGAVEYLLAHNTTAGIKTINVQTAGYIGKQINKEFNKMTNKALCIAIANNDIEMVELLIKNGAEINSNNGLTIRNIFQDFRLVLDNRYREKMNNYKEATDNKIKVFHLLNKYNADFSKI